MILEYAKTHPEALDPERANPSDAGLDVYFNPQDGELTWIEPGSSARLETGLIFGIPHGYMLQVMNRSSVASKRNLVVGAHVVDSGYSGEVFIDLHNVGTEVQAINPGDKIAQVVLVPVIHFRSYEVDEHDLYGDYPITISARGTGALGSTGESFVEEEYDDDYDEEQEDEDDWDDEDEDDWDDEE